MQTSSSIASIRISIQFLLARFFSGIRAFAFQGQNITEIMSSSTNIELNRIIADLKSKNDETKEKAVAELLSLITTTSHSISHENFVKFSNGFIIIS